jgi:hypothetical protein
VAAVSAGAFAAFVGRSHARDLADRLDDAAGFSSDERAPHGAGGAFFALSANASLLSASRRPTSCTRRHMQ